jgi:hypothetical protein
MGFALKEVESKELKHLPTTMKKEMITWQKQPASLLMVLSALKQQSMVPMKYIYLLQEGVVTELHMQRDCPGRGVIGI